MRISLKSKACTPKIGTYPVNTNISTNIGQILGRQHNCRHCWPDKNRYRAIIGPMLTEFNIICADNSTADADEISETDIGPISAHCRHACCCPNIGIQYRPDIGSLSTQSFIQSSKNLYCTWSYKQLFSINNSGLGVACCTGEIDVCGSMNCSDGMEWIARIFSNLIKSFISLLN